MRREALEVLVMWVSLGHLAKLEAEERGVPPDLQEQLDFKEKGESLVLEVFQDPQVLLALREQMVLMVREDPEVNLVPLVR